MKLSCEKITRAKAHLELDLAAAVKKEQKMLQKIYQQQKEG